MAGPKTVPKYIIEKRVYYDDRGRTLFERIVVQGEAPPGFPRFEAPTSVTLQTATGPKGTQFGVELPAKTILEAYAVMDAEIARGQKEKILEMMRNVAEFRRKKVLIAPAGAIDEVERRRRELGGKGH